MTKSRKKNVALNVLFGYIAQVGIILLSFVGRKIFLNYLSIEYLGVNGLYSNILTLLSLPELGVDTAVVYFLYKPVAEDNKALIASLIAFFRKLYIGLALCILALGLLLVPFLDVFIKSDLGSFELKMYYLLFMINTVSSYFVGHKVALLFAYQEQRVQKITILCSNFVAQILHIIVLVIWKNYYVYLAVTLVGTIVNNFMLANTCNKRHPLKLDAEYIDFEKKPIIEKIKSTFLYKIASVLINSTDNILISSIVGTAAVGLYANYHTVIAAIQGFLGIITTSLISSVGNLSAKGEREKQYRYFNFMLLFYHFVAALGTIGFYLLLNNFITIWLGSEYLFDDLTVLVIALNFYVSNAVNPVWMYREANGLFEKVKYLLLTTAVINIILSIVFGMMWGVFGILFATIVSKVITTIWYEPKVLYNKVMKADVSCYWKKQGKYFALSIIALLISAGIIGSITDSILGFAIKAIIIVVTTSAVFLVGNLKTEEVDLFKTIIKRR